MKLLINYLQIKLFRLKPLARKKVVLALLASMLIFNQSNAINFSFGGLFSSLFSKKSTSGLIGANLVSANSAVANAAKKPFLNTKTLGLAILSVGCVAVIGYVLNFAIKRYKENKLAEEKKLIEGNKRLKEEKLAEEKWLIDKLKRILRYQNSLHEEKSKEFKDTLSALEKIAGSSIGKIIDGNLLLHKAAKYGRTEAIRALVAKGADIEAKDEDGCTPLLAVRYCETEAIKALLELGADAEEKRLLDKLKEILRNQNSLHEEKSKEFKDTLSALEKIAGSSIGKIIYKFALLHEAAKYGKIEAIKLLVELGADIEAKTKIGSTPLRLAALNNRTKAIKVLLELGAEIEAKDVDGRTALHLAVINGQTEAIKVLVEKGADIEAEYKDRVMELHWSERYDRTEAKDEDGRTAIYWAAYRGETKAIKVLLGHDADAFDIFFRFDKYIPLVFEKCICGNRGNNTEKINSKINVALEKIKVKANKSKRLYRDLKNSLIVIQDLSGIRIEEDKRVVIQKISLDELGIIMSFTGIYFGKKIDGERLSCN